MKRGNLFGIVLAFLILSVFIPETTEAQTTAVLGNNEYVAFYDTVSNGVQKEFSYEISPGADSVSIALYASGSIDLDSLNVKLGRTATFRHNGYSNNWIYKLSAVNATYATGLSIDLDSAGTSYTTRVVTISGADLRQNNLIDLIILAASSGNDATDPKQALGVIITVY